MAGKPLEVEIFVRRGGELLPYAALTEAEKEAFARSLNERAIRAVAELRGYDAQFYDTADENRKNQKKEG